MRFSLTISTKISIPSIPISPQESRFTPETARYSAYLPCNRIIEKEEFENLFPAGAATILMGDLNAKHPEWNSGVINSKGDALFKLAQDKGLVVISPDEPTQIHDANSSTDVLDIAIANDIMAPVTLQVISDLHSNHFPILAQIDYSREYSAMDALATNWTKFNRNIVVRPIIINDIGDIDAIVLQFQEDIPLAKEAATGKLNPTKKKNNKMPQKSGPKFPRRKRWPKNTKGPFTQGLNPGSMPSQMKSSMTYDHEDITTTSKYGRKSWKI